MLSFELMIERGLPKRPHASGKEVKRPGFPGGGFI